VLVLAGLLFPAIATAGACPAGLDAVRTAKLIFGRDIGDRPGVSDADWRGFVARQITPRFPDGITVEDARGQWLGRSGRLVHERSKVVLIVLAGRPDEPERLAAIAHAYEAQFHQDAVLLIEEDACATFKP
jgi:hypothetical protein